MKPCDLLSKPKRYSKGAGGKTLSTGFSFVARPRTVLPSGKTARLVGQGRRKNVIHRIQFCRPPAHSFVWQQKLRDGSSTVGEGCIFTRTFAGGKRVAGSSLTKSCTPMLCCPPLYGLFSCPPSALEMRRSKPYYFCE